MGIRYTSGKTMKVAVAFAILVLLQVGAPTAGANGPRAVTASGAPVKWFSFPITYKVDNGGLGTMTHAQANQLVSQVFGTWAAVSTATVSAIKSSTDGLGPDGDVSNGAEFSSLGCAGVNPVVYDTDGQVIEDLFGAGTSNSILGFAGVCDFNPVTGQINGGHMVLNGKGDDGTALAQSRLKGTAIHELGHELGLDHSQINWNECVVNFCANGSDAIFGVPTMFPFALTSQEVVGQDFEVTLATDDIAWISALYPAANFSSTTGTIDGQIFFGDGVDPFMGANVIARRVDNPNSPQNESLRFAVSATSGYLARANYGNAIIGRAASQLGSTDGTVRGVYHLPGLPVLGATGYTVEVESIDPFFTGNSGIGPQGNDRQTIIPLSGPAEFYSSPETATDDPATRTTVTLNAGLTVSSIDIILNDTLTQFDFYESAANRNDSIATALSINNGALTASISPFSADVDFYKFVPASGQEVDFAIDTSAGSLDPVMAIRNSSGTILNLCDTDGDFIFTNPCVVNGIFLSFRPVAAGNYFLSVSDAFGDARPDFLYTLTTTGVTTVVGTVALNPTAINFGSQTLGSTSAPQTVTVTNSGPGMVKLTTVNSTPNISDFQQAQPLLFRDCVFGSTMQLAATGPGSSCNWRGTFTPHAAGARSTTLSLSFANATNSPRTLALSGTSTAATDNVFTNAGGTGAWETPGNWSLGHVPVVGERAVINGAAPSSANVTVSEDGQTASLLSMTSGGTLAISSGSLILNADSSATNITVSGGILTMAGLMTTSGTFTLSSGTINGSGEWISNGTSNISGGTLDLTFDNGGTANIGNFTLGRPFNNLAAATTNASAAGSINPGGSLFGSINNQGLFKRSVGAGSYSIDASIPFAQSGAIQVLNGTLLIKSGYTQTAGSTTVASGAILNVGSGSVIAINGGTLSGGGTIVAFSVTNNSGTVNPGTSAGTLTINGRYTQSAGGTLNIELGGTTAGTFDVLAISNTASLGGTLNVTSSGGFTPAQGNSFRVMTFLSRSGDFTTNNLTVNGVTLTKVVIGTNVALIAPGNDFTNGSGDNQWTTAANWSFGHVPTSSEAATIGSGKSPVIDSGAQSIQSLTMSGTAALTISGGSLTYANASTATTLIISGGTLTANANLSVSGTFNLTFGTLSVLSPANVTTTGTLTVSGGTLLGTGTITGNIFNTGGTINPGNSPGTLNISGSYAQGASGILTIELGGGGAGSFDVFAISGTATLAGILNVTSSGGFTPASGNSFQVMTFTSESGDFNINNLTVNGVTLTKTLNATNITLSTLGNGSAGPPAISKAFGAATIPLGGTTTLSFTITNPNAGTSINGVAFTDALPAGLVVGAVPGVITTCGGSTTAVAGASSISLSGGGITPSNSCTITVNVTGTTAGLKSNTTGTVSSTEGGTGATSNTATTTVVAPPAISKAFGTDAIAVGGTTTLSFTISNPNAGTALTGVAVSDLFPAGLVVATPNGLSNTCAGAPSAVAGSGTVSISAGAIAAGGSCTFTVNITGTTAGLKSNTTGTVSSTEGGTGATSNTATVTVVAVTPPTISKSFGAATIPLSETTTLSFTISNPNAGTALTGVAVSDLFPAGLVVATPNGLSNTCAGAPSAVAGSGTVSISAGAIAAGGSCTFTVNITGTTAGLKSNTTGTVSSTEGGTGATSNTATITVVAPPAISKAFGTDAIAVGGTTALSFTITNPNAETALTGVAVSDLFPAGLVVATPNGLSNTCAGAPSAVAGSGTVSISAGAIAAGGSCTFTVNITGTTAGLKSNTTGTVSSTEGGTGATSNTATTTVVAPPAISKSFGTDTMAVGGTTTLSFTISNPNAGISLSGVAFTDALPVGLAVAAVPGVITTCGGSTTAVGGASSISLSGGVIAASDSCTLTVNVTGTTAGLKNNTTGAVSSTEGGTGATSNTATVTVVAVTPPTISKSFGAATIPLSGTTTLSFTISNPNAGTALTGVAVSDLFPAGLVVATPNGLSNTCAGAPSAVAGSGTVSISAGAIAAGGSCTFTVNITGTTAGLKNNTTGAVSSTEGGTGATSNTATITVVAPPAISKVFGTGAMPVGGTTTLSFTISNPNAETALTGVAVSDLFPAGLVVATPNGLSNTCAGAPSAVAGSGTVSISAGAIAAGGSCTFTVNITGTTAGLKSNTTGTVSSTEGGTGATSNTATVTVVAVTPPTISKSFGAATIPLSETTTLSFTISNPNAGTALTGVAVSDLFPAGLVVATPNGLSNTCAGAPSAVAGANSVSLSAGTLSAGGSCTLTVNVTGTTAGLKNNTTGAVSSTEGGTGATSNTATITVVAPPAISKVFGTGAMPVGGTTTLSFTISNPNAETALTGVAVSDLFPAGLVVATPNGLSNTCAGAPSAVAGSGTVSISAGAIAAGGSCTFTVNITGTTAGLKSNTTGTVSSTEGGTGATSNTATVTVVAVTPPTISKSFGAATIPLSETTTLSFTISNPNAGTALTGVAVSDLFPAGLVVATPNGLSNTCAGAPSAVAGANSVSLSAGTLSAGGSCTLTVNVTGTTAGLKNNTTGAVSSTEGGTGATSNTATITVVAPPAISKVFGTGAMPVGGTTTLSFTITNPNAETALTGVAVSDLFPAGLVVATPNGLSNTCAGAPSAVAGSGTVSISAGAIAAGGSCTFTVNITGTTAGLKSNTTGTVSSTEGGTGATSNTATTTVVAPPAISKSFGTDTMAVGGTTTLSFTISNPNAGISLSGVAFTDALPVGLAVAAVPGVITTCGGSTTAVGGASSISLSGGVIAASDSCTLTVNVTGTTAGLKNNTTGAVSSTEGGTGATSNTATVTVVAVTPPTISKSFGAATIPLSGTTTLSFTISNPNAGTALTGVAVSDLFPAGLVVATPNGLSNTCAGAPSAVAGSGTVSISAGAIAAGGSCTFTVNITGTTAGLKNNTTGAVSSTEGGTGATSNTATITVVAPPAISKVFGTGAMPVGGTTTLSFTISNPNAETALTGVAVSDLFPAGLVVATPNGLSNTCAGAPSAVAGSGTVSISAGAIAAGGSCTFTVNITGTTAGLKSNTTGTVSSTEGGTGATSNTATVTVVAVTPPTISKSFGAATIPLSETTTLSFTISNPNAGTALTGVAVSDLFPAGLVVATPNGLSNTCAGAPSAVAGANSVSLSAGTLSAGGSCTLTVNVTGTTAGLKNNTTGAVSSTEGGTGATSNTATITVVAPPAISKVFGTGAMPVGGTTTLSFTITNPNAETALTGVAVSDLFPAGLVVATPNGLSNTCAGAPSAVAGANSVSLLAGALSAGGSCTLTVNVTGTTAGLKNNTTGAVSSTEGGTGATSNTATVTVVAVTPPTISKSFGAATIPLSETTTLSFTISNPNAGTALTGVAVSDLFPAGLVVATPNGLSNTCAGAPSAVAGSGTVSISAGAIAAGGSCTFTVNITGTTAGLKSNTTGTVSSTEGGTGATSNTATITVVAPPTISKAFGTGAMPVGGTTALSFTITNPNAETALTGVAVSDLFPAGLVVATPNGLSNTCAGAPSAVAGANSVSLLAGTLSAGGSCTLTVNVTGTTAGLKSNTTGTVSSTEAGSGVTSNTATVTVLAVAPPTISKAFGAEAIPVGGTTTLSFTISNPNAGISLSGVAFTDDLPAGLVVAAVPGAITTCGGSTTAVGGASSISLSGGVIAASDSCTLTVNVTGTAAGLESNITDAVSSTEGGTGATSNTATITVVAPPAISKVFGTGAMPVGGTTTLSFTISNPNAGTALTGVAVSDLFPAGLVVATPNGLSNTCAGAPSAVAGANSVSLLAGALSAGGSCTLTVNVTGTTAGLKSNTTGTVSSTEAGSGVTSNTATVTVLAVAPPTISKAFGAEAIPVGGTTTLSFTITNPNAGSTLTGVAVTDTLPSGLVVSTPNGLSNTCAGAPSAVAGSGTVSISAGTIAARSLCTLTVNVTGTTAGPKSNTTGAVSATEGGTGSISNTAMITVVTVAPPTISKAFGTGAIAVGGTTTLSFTITNPNSEISLSGVAFTDDLPAGLVVGAVPGAITSCSGNNTAVGGASSISLSGGVIAASDSCTLTVNVTGTTAGLKSNTTGTVSSTEGGTGATSNIATITVVAPPTISKSFGAATIPLSGTTTLSFTISNPNAGISLSGVAFTDALPVGLVVAAVPGVITTCGGSTTAVGGASSISLSGGVIAASDSCTLTVNVTGTTAGLKNNTTGTVSSTEGGTGATSNIVTITVVVPPTISKVFGTGAMPVGGTTTLSFTISNPNAGTALTGVAVSDLFPAGLVVAAVPGVITTCGGSTTAVGGASSISLAGGVIAASDSCTLTVNVTGTTAGLKNNTTGTVSSTEGGTGATSNTATVTVVAVTPPTISKSFGAATIPLSGTTTLSFTISNPNAGTALTGVAVSDLFPAGLVVATPNGLSNTCAGAPSAVAGANSVSLSAGTLSAGGSCTLTVNVTGTTAGLKNNTTGTVSSTEAGSGVTSNTATVTVLAVASPTISKAFGTGAIAVGGTTTLSFTITNPNAGTALTGVAFTDTLPAGLVVSTPNGLSNTCAGAPSAVAGSGTVSISAGTIAAGGSCTFKVNVTGTTAGLKSNTTGTVSSTEGGTGATSNTATIWSLWRR